MNSISFLVMLREKAMTRVFHIDISQIEDQLLNPLNSILMLCYGNKVYNEVEKEIWRIIEVLEKEHLINNRLRKG